MLTILFPPLSTLLLHSYINSTAEQYMSIGYRLIQSLWKGEYRQLIYKILAAMITLDDFGCIRDLSDSLDVLYCGFRFLNTFGSWSRYLPYRKSGSKGGGVLSPSRWSTVFPLARGIGGYCYEWNLMCPS